MPAPHGKGIWGKRTGAISCDVLDAWFEPSPSVRTALGRSLHLINVSPDVELLALRNAVSDVRGVDFDSISFGAGSSEIIHRVMPQIVCGGKAVVLDPTYSEYRYLFSKIGCRVESLALCSETSFNV